LLEGKNIVVGVTGGIAVYKAVDVISRLKKLKADIKVIMTESAEKFVTPLTFQTLSQNHVVSDMFAEVKSWDVDLFLVVPATANIIGKVANGIADDMLSTTIMATEADVVFAPAMNTNMYKNPVFKQNMDRLKSLGYLFIDPASGRLACGDYGEGKLADPEDIVESVINYFTDSKDLAGKKIIVTAGPTIERIDPVRYITNNSSGKMGYEIAKKAEKRGAKVVLISGPTNLEKPIGVKTIDIDTTEDMFNAVKSEYGENDILIKAAAPLDYSPVEYSDKKIKKSDGNLHLEFKRNIDIANYFGKHKLESQILIGFAAESDDLIENAKGKLIRKNLDFIVANDITAEGIGFKSDKNKVLIIDKTDGVTELSEMPKADLANIILDRVLNCLNEKAR
jgi:phosphopantothenoylcysteine decarboxylase / phosphopantothenate---cysteine ligase